MEVAAAFEISMFKGADLGAVSLDDFLVCCLNRKQPTQRLCICLIDLSSHMYVCFQGS